MPVSSNLVHQTTTSTGTGNLTLAAVNGRRSFDTAFGNGGTTNVFDYFISNRDATEWERGTGHMSSSTTFVRDTVIESSNANAAVSFSAGTKDVTNAVPAQVLNKIIGKNYLHNAGFQIDERNQGSSASIADDVYCFDRWYALTQTASITVVRQADQENGTPFNIQLSQAQASAQRMGIAQIAESRDCKNLRGKIVTLSGRIRCSSSQAIRYAILEWTGTADAVTSDVVNSWTNGTFTAGQFFNSTTLTVAAVGTITPAANTWTDITSLQATISSSLSNVIVMVWTEGTAAQNVTLDVGFLKLEAGAMATPFEPLPTAEDLAICQRYFEVLSAASNGSAGWGVAQVASTSRAVLSLVWKVQKRIAPTVSLSAFADWAFYNAAVSAFVVWSSFASQQTTEWGGFLDVATATAGLGGAGDAAIAAPNAATSAARIYVTADL